MSDSKDCPACGGSGDGPNDLTPNIPRERGLPPFSGKQACHICGGTGRVSHLYGTKKFPINDPTPYPMRYPYDMPRNTSGLVPYPCEHGLAAKPARYPVMGPNPVFDEQGGELPPWGNISWGRSKHFMTMEPVLFSGHVSYHPVPDCCRGTATPEQVQELADA